MTEQAHIEMWPSVAWAMPAEINVEEIAEDACQAAFALIHERLKLAGYPASGDVMPHEQLGLDNAFQTFVRMAALNSSVIGAMQCRSARDGEWQCDQWLEIDDEEGFCTRPLGHEGLHTLRTCMSNPPYEVLR